MCTVGLIYCRSFVIAFRQGLLAGLVISRGPGRVKSRGPGQAATLPGNLRTVGASHLCIHAPYISGQSEIANSTFFAACCVFFSKLLHVGFGCLLQFFLQVVGVG